MADTNPIAKTKDTTEGRISLVVTYVSLAAAVVGAVATAVLPFIEPLSQQFSERQWAALAFTVSGLLTAAWAAGKLVIGRSSVKSAMISTDTPPMGGAVVHPPK